MSKIRSFLATVISLVASQGFISEAEAASKPHTVKQEDRNNVLQVDKNDCSAVSYEQKGDINDATIYCQQDTTVELKQRDNNGSTIHIISSGSGGVKIHSRQSNK